MVRTRKYINEKTLLLFSLAIMFTGIALRVIFFLQNRCLIIDEANIARNIYERNFTRLFEPLDYEQYAPPFFLWIVKCFTLVFGYGELAFRLYPLICGIASLGLMFVVLKKLVSPDALWYPLFIIATGFLYVRYSAELKQYISDVVIVLTLILFTLRINIIAVKPLKFFILWCVIGSLTIWISMPGVFMLAGAGLYYLYEAVRAKTYNKILLLGGIGVIWLLQFGVYYRSVLSPQINSAYLQNWHKDFFLFLVPKSKAEWQKNVDVLGGVIEAMGGKWLLSVAFHLLTLITGCVYLFIKHRSKFILLTVPVICLLLAAALHQYALTTRLILFIMPVFLILIGIGLQQLFRIGKIWLTIPLIICSAICIFNFGAFFLFHDRMDYEQITENLEYMQSRKITNETLCVHHLAMPAYLYYTTIHPGKAKWQSLGGAYLLHWNSNYDSLAQSFTGCWGLIYSNLFQEDLDAQQEIIRRHCNVKAHNTVAGGQAFIYDRKRN